MYIYSQKRTSLLLLFFLQMLLFTQSHYLKHLHSATPPQSSLNSPVPSFPGSGSPWCSTFNTGTFYRPSPNKVLYWGLKKKKIKKKSSIVSEVLNPVDFNQSKMFLIPCPYQSFRSLESPVLASGIRFCILTPWLLNLFLPGKYICTSRFCAQYSSLPLFPLD